MARTQAADFGQRQQVVIDQAAQLFAKRGFLGTSISDVAAACKMSKSLIYHYYSSKEDILFAVMSSHVEALTSAAEEILSLPETAEERLRLICHSFMQKYAGAADHHKVLLNEMENISSLRRTTLVSQQRMLIAMLEHLIGQCRPEIASEKAWRRPIAMMFFGMINWTHTWFDPQGALNADDVAELAIQIFLGGLPAVRPKT